MKTLDEQIRCVEREIALRRAVYPKQIEKGKMKGNVAQHEIECMEAVLETLKSINDPLTNDTSWDTVQDSISTDGDKL